MTQPNSTEKTSLKPTESQPAKEPGHDTKLSNSVWESIKQDSSKRVSAASWVEGNVLAPLYNEAIVRPVNTIIDKAQMLHAPISKLVKAEIPDAPINTAAFYAQNLSSTAGNFGWQLAAGHFAGKAFRSGGESLAQELERTGHSVATASTIRNLASNRMLHNVTGAVGYAAFVDPEAGETRKGNMVAAGEGMLLFEGTNKLIGNRDFLDPKAIALRAAAGAPIGASQQFLSTLVATGKVDTDASHYDKAMAAGAFMNVLLPGAKGLESVGSKLGMHTYADTFAEQQHAKAVAALKPGEKVEPGSWADPIAARQAIEAGKIDITVKARHSDTEVTSIDHLKRLVTLKKGDSPSQFVEENFQHKLSRDPEFLKGLNEATQMLKDGDREGGRQKYIETRVAQEVDAHKARLDAIRTSGATFESTSVNPVDVAREYAQKFSDEANNFVNSKGIFRPAVSFSHGGIGGHAPHDGVVMTQGVGIGPHASHDGAPHPIGDAGTATSAERATASAIEAGAARRSVLDSLPPNTRNLKLTNGHGYDWPNSPDGVKWLGHDNVKSVNWDDNMRVITLEKVDPVTGKIASVVKNYAEPQSYVLPDKSVAFKFSEKEQNLYTAHTTFKIDEPGSWNMPKGAEWDVINRRVNLEIAGQPVWVDNVLRHQDATGRVDYNVAGTDTKITEHTVPQIVGEASEVHDATTGELRPWKPGDRVDASDVGEDGKPYFFLYQRSQERSDGSVSRYITDPRKLDPEFPRAKLSPDGTVDDYPEGKPLGTSLGNFETAYRFPDEMRYQNFDSIKVVHFEENRLRVTSWKEGDAAMSTSYVDSVKENYPGGRDTQWGRADSIEVKPKGMVVNLSNGGKVEIANAKAYPDGATYEEMNPGKPADERFANNRFGQIRRIDTAPPTKNSDGSTTPGDISLIREIKTPEGKQYSTVVVPATPKFMAEIPNFKVDAYESLPGDTNATKYYLSDHIEFGKKTPMGTVEIKADGFLTDDILKNGPYPAVWRYPGGLAFLGKVENNGVTNWTKSSITFSNEATNHQQPMVILNNDIGDSPNIGTARAFSRDELVNTEGQNVPLVTEFYLKGQATRWGTATNRSTLADGSARMKMKDGSFVIVDANEAFLARIPAQPQ